MMMDLLSGELGCFRKLCWLKMPRFYKSTKLKDFKNVYTYIPKLFFSSLKLTSLMIHYKTLVFFFNFAKN